MLIDSMTFHILKSEQLVEKKCFYPLPMGSDSGQGGLKGIVREGPMGSLKVALILVVRGGGFNCNVLYHVSLTILLSLIIRSM